MFNSTRDTLHITYQLAIGEFLRLNADLTTSAIVSEVMPLFLALLELNQVTKSLLPLDALQPTQQIAILSTVVILISLMMCSQDFFLALSLVNVQPQYTQD